MSSNENKQQPQESAPAAKKGKSRGSGLRRFLLIVGPVAVILVGGWFYLTGGRYIGTDNAYVKTDIISVAPEVSGIIRTVAIDENAQVTKGQTLFTIEDTSYAIAVSMARANLTAAVTQIEALKARYAQKEQDISVAQSDLTLAQKNYDRRAGLKKQNSSALSEAEMDNATHELDTAQQRIDVLKQEEAEILAMLNGDADIAAEDHPTYKAAKATLEKAELDLARTTVTAPADGVIRRVPKPGDYAQAGLSAMNLATTGNMWVEANYKETELTNMHPGQKVEIEVDTYPGVKWEGTVESISPATESEFSILPAQNATGNWVKVVQRIPVRIAIHGEPNSPQLRAGMSSHVTVDTEQWPHLPAAFAADGK
jgi:membrane fusion protein (multidrug efflux system)